MESDTTYSFRLKDSLLGAQMLFVAFGALVLVPILTGMSTNVALFTAGVGTLIFQICTRGKVPVFLASSFAFIAPIIYGVQTWGLPATLGGMVVAGAVYVVLSFIIRWRGTEIIMRLLPPIVTGPVIIVIGLVLAPVGVNMALGKRGACPREHGADHFDGGAGDDGARFPARARHDTPYPHYVGHRRRLPVRHRARHPRFQQGGRRAVVRRSGFRVPRVPLGSHPVHHPHYPCPGH